MEVSPLPFLNLYFIAIDSGMLIIMTIDNTNFD